MLISVKVGQEVEDYSLNQCRVVIKYILKYEKLKWKINLEKTKKHHKHKEKHIYIDQENLQLNWSTFEYQRINQSWSPIIPTIKSGIFHFLFDMADLWHKVYNNMEQTFGKWNWNITNKWVNECVCCQMLWLFHYDVNNISMHIENLATDTLGYNIQWTVKQHGLADTST